MNDNLIKKLTSNRITHCDLNDLMEIATSDDLKSITQSVFDMDEATLLERSAVEGATRWLNSLKNDRRKALYVKKIQYRPSNELKKVVAEGDSLFHLQYYSLFHSLLVDGMVYSCPALDWALLVVEKTVDF